MCLLLRGTEKCSENGWDKQEKLGQKRSKGENSEENGSESDFIGLPMPAFFFFGRKRSICFHWQESHFIPFRRHKYARREKGVEQVVCACTFASDFLLFPLLSSGLGTRISPAYICTEQSKNDN
ncbi:hypothetical protein PORCAN_879 [Porphyromonas crevioricanis JCM 13913]|nr:hypothetical protein PORCAN_879 [Porphyromonas crevioricanis JCM 13913]